MYIIVTEIWNVLVKKIITKVILSPHDIIRRFHCTRIIMVWYVDYWHILRYHSIQYLLVDPVYGSGWDILSVLLKNCFWPVL
jgi:hypothetical protein